MAELVLVKGAGEMATGVAHRLYRAGLSVVMTELPAPQAVRRTVSFCEAVLEGEVEVEGVRAVAYPLAKAGSLVGTAWDHVPVFVDPTGELVGLLRPEVVVDARILKRNLDNHLELAPLVIGLGPGLEAGRDVHVVIETHRGHDLGRLLTAGQALADTGVPGVLGGQSHLRVLRSPRDGVLESECEIGDRVGAGEAVARVDGVPVESGLDGVLRGLVFPGSRVTAGQKIGDVDPRGERRACFTISDKARALGGSVLEAVVAHLRGVGP